MKPIDATPELSHDEIVQHGYFEQAEDGSLWCSCCHYGFTRLYPRKYCPNCGAKMDIKKGVDPSVIASVVVNP